MAAATVSRIQSGPAKAAQGPGSTRPLSTVSRASHASQVPGLSTNETAAMTAVVPSAMARLRHWRRAANHARHTPGVTLVSSTNAHAAGCDSPTTSATASNRLMLPARISNATNGTRNSTAPKPRPSHARASSRIRGPSREVQRVRQPAEGRRDGQEHRSVEVRPVHVHERVVRVRLDRPPSRRRRRIPRCRARSLPSRGGRARSPGWRSRNRSTTRMGDTRSGRCIAGDAGTAPTRLATTRTGYRRPGPSPAGTGQDERTSVIRGARGATVLG